MSQWERGRLWRIIKMVQTLDPSSKFGGIREKKENQNHGQCYCSSFHFAPFLEPLPTIKTMHRSGNQTQHHVSEQPLTVFWELWRQILKITWAWEISQVLSHLLGLLLLWVRNRNNCFWFLLLNFISKYCFVLIIVWILQIHSASGDTILQPEGASPSLSLATYVRQRPLPFLLLDALYVHFKFCFNVLNILIL